MVFRNITIYYHINITLDKIMDQFDINPLIRVLIYNISKKNAISSIREISLYNLLLIAQRGFF